MPAASCTSSRGRDPRCPPAPWSQPWPLSSSRRASHRALLEPRISSRGGGRGPRHRRRLPTRGHGVHAHGAAETGPGHSTQLSRDAVLSDLFFSEAPPHGRAAAGRGAEELERLNLGRLRIAEGLGAGSRRTVPGGARHVEVDQAQQRDGCHDRPDRGAQTGVCTWPIS